MKKTKRASDTQDATYLFKLFMYLVLGSIWIKLSHGASLQLPIPMGFVIGLIFSAHEHFQIDRKIEYAILLVALLLGYASPFGLYINF